MSKNTIRRWIASGVVSARRFGARTIRVDIAAPVGRRLGGTHPRVTS